jgi:HEAT repeat protein
VDAAEAVRAVQAAAREAGAAALYTAVAVKGLNVQRREPGGSSHAPLAEVYVDAAALAADVERGNDGAVGAALHALAARDAAALLPAALALAAHKGELRRCAFFALAESDADEALDILLGALDGSSVPRGALGCSRHPRAVARVRAALAATGATIYVPCARPTLAEWYATPPAERRKLSADAAAAQGAGPASAQPARAATAIAVLGDLGDAASIDDFGHMLETHPNDRIRLACAHALATIADPRAAAVLDRRLTDLDGNVSFLAVRAALARQAATGFAGAWERFAPHLALASFADEVLVSRLLRALTGTTAPRRVDPALDPLLHEPRFVDLAARLRRHETLGGEARRLLAALPLATAVAAIERNPIDAAALYGAGTAAPVRPARGDFLARYQAGEHSAWDELVRAAPAVLAHDDLRSEAQAVARALMQRVRRNADTLRATLREAGARLPAEAPPATAGSTAAATLARLGALAGPVPIALAAFYEAVGEINLTPPGRDYDYGPCALEADGIALLALDPLVIDGLGVVARDLDDYQAEIDDSHREIVGPLRLAFAPDFLHKQNISGGAPYGFVLPPPDAAEAIDPSVLDEGHDETLVGYLRLAFRWGGFPGLEVVADGQPPEQIDLNLRIPFKRVKGSWATAANRLLDRLRRNLEPF